MLVLRSSAFVCVGLLAAFALARSSPPGEPVPVDSAMAMAAPVAKPTGESATTPGLRYPEEYSSGIFRWESAPDWVITDVLFGVHDGGLVFAKYTAIPPGQVPKVHDHLASVDAIVLDTLHLSTPVRMKVGGFEAEALISGFSFMIDELGVVRFSSLRGVHPDGTPFDASFASRGTNSGAAPENGACDPPTVVGTCNGTFCSGVCVADIPDRDPCDCFGGGAFNFCTDGTAQIVCPVGTCTRVCIFANAGGCGCFVCGGVGQVAVYCTAKKNSLSCIPEIHWSGGPMVSVPVGFTVSADLVLNNVFGILIYNKAGPAAIPFQGAFLCLQPPVTRTQAQNSLGNNLPPGSDCSGNFKLQFNQVIASGMDPGLVAGAVVCLQYWYRDPFDPTGFGSGLSDAIRAVICP